MGKIILDKKQTKEIAEAVRGDIKNYCDINFEQFIEFF